MWCFWVAFHEQTTGADATALSIAAFVSLESQQVWDGRVFRNGDDLLRADLGLGRNLKSYIINLIE